MKKKICALFLLTFAANALADNSLLDPQATIEKEGYETKRVSKDGTTWYVLGKTEPQEHLALIESRIDKLPKDASLLSVCDLMRGGIKAKLIEQTGESYDVAVTNYGHYDGIVVCVLKLMLGNKIGTQISFMKVTKGKVFSVFLKT